MKKAPSRLLFPVRRHRKPASPDQRRGRFFRFFHLFAPLFLSVSLLFRRTADVYYTTTRNIRELQLARRGCPGRSHYSPPLSAISIPTAPPRWLPSIPWAGAKSANCTANYKISRRAFPPAGARFFILLLKLQKTKRGLKSTTFRQFQSSLAQKEGFELLDQKLFLFYCAVSCPIPL